jgi:LysR family glycine cleavage system transcriptional activator
MKSRYRLAPLNGLRAFESAARHLSFSMAATELSVTAGAISHQIAALEDFLDVKLFHRGPRGVTLTAAAEACLPLLSQGFSTIREAVALLDGDASSRPLTVNVAPAFATRWLLPRLATFTTVHPDIELRVSTGLGLIDTQRLEPSSGLDEMVEPEIAADVSIRFGRGEYPGLKSEKLFEAAITPVCGPRLLNKQETPLQPTDLRRFTLLHHDTAYFDGDTTDWAVWLKAAGVDGIDANRGPRFSHAGLALDAAEDGLGFALGITALTAADFLSGRLVAPFALRLASNYSYHLVCSKSLNDHPDLQTFRAWLVAEAEQDQRLLSQQQSMV